MMRATFLLIVSVLLTPSAGAQVPVCLADSELLVNGSFETGSLSGWSELQGSGNAHVVTQTAGTSCQRIDPGTPRTGQFLLTCATVNGATPFTPEITIGQVIDLTPFVLSPSTTVRAEAFVAGAPGCGGTSDDTVQLILEIYQGGIGGSLVASASTPPLDPVVGSWNQLTIPPAALPAGADTVVFRIRTLLDPGAASIDIAVDDASVVLAGAAAQPLRVTGSEISLAAGGSALFHLCAGAARAGDAYLLVGSALGTSPGIPLGSLVLPLVFDEYTQITLDFANVGPFVNTLGALDPSGSALAELALPPGLPPALAGFALHHAYFTVSGSLVTLTSNPVTLVLVP